MADEIKKEETIVVEKPEVKEEAQAPTVEATLDKVQKGETLTDQETEIVKNISREDLTPPPAEEKKEERKEEAPAPVAVEERRKLIEAEVDKPRERQNLKQFTPTELSIFWELKKSKQKNQVLRDELEVAHIENIVTNLRNKEKEKEKPKEEAPPQEDALDLLKDKDDGDILTVAEAKELIRVLKQPAPVKKEESTQPLRTADQIRLERVEASSVLASQGVTDFHEVIDFAETALKDDKEAISLLKETAREGGNTVEQTYWLIKGSKAWPTIEKYIADQKAKPKAEQPAGSAEAIKRGQKIVENEQKIRTIGGGGGAPPSAEEFSIAEISRMTHQDIRKLPKATREKILQKYGSEPNYSV